MSQAELKIIQNDLHAIWSYVQKDLINHYGEAIFRNWFSKLNVISNSKSELTLSVPTNFMREWINTYYLESIKNYWKKYDSQMLYFYIVVIALPDSKIIQKSEEAATQKEFFNKLSIASNDDLLISSLDARFTFENFIVDSSNEFAYAAALSIAKSSSVNPKSNPLFLYSGVGLGKTHLMQSIAWYVHSNNPGKKIIYMSAEKFMYQFIRALRNKDMMNFKDQFRNVDILMIDDIQFICGKDSTQEEFFHTFNSLVDNGKQIIISCDRIPNNLENIEDRIRSRLNGGLVADINNSNYSLRLKILISKAKNMNFSIPKNVLEFLAENIQSNIRELEGALNKVIAHAHLRNLEINIDNAKHILHDVIYTNTAVSISDIQKYISRFHNISIDDLKSAKRARIYSRPRQIAIYLSKILTQKSLIEISREFKRKDHTTIMHAIKNITSLRSKDSNLDQELKLIICNLKK